MRNSMAVWVFLASVAACLSGASGAEGERVFPLGRQWAGDQKLPLPFGAGLTFHRQDQGYDIVKLGLKFEGPVAGLDLSQAAGVEIDNELLEVNAKFDLWLLPFLNLFGLIGNVEGETSVGGPVVESFLGNAMIVDYEGVVYGGGATLAGGWKRLFGSVTYTYTDTDLEGGSSAINAWVLTPKVGLTNDRGAIWVGAMYQEAEEKQKGQRTVGVVFPVQTTLRVAYDAELEQKQAWNYLAGIHGAFWDHWEIELEGGFGERKQATISAAYRF